MKAAVLSCFILALLEEVEVKGEEVVHIRKKCQAYIDKVKNTNALEIIANEAWDVACNYPTEPEWSPAITLVKLWDKYAVLLKEKVGLNPKFGERLFNKQTCSLKVKIDSGKIAKYCNEAINKTMYKHKELI